MWLCFILWTSVRSLILSLCTKFDSQSVYHKVIHHVKVKLIFLSKIILGVVSSKIDLLDEQLLIISELSSQIIVNTSLAPKSLALISSEAEKCITPKLIPLVEMKKIKNHRNRNLICMNDIKSCLLPSQTHSFGSKSFKWGYQLWTCLHYRSRGSWVCWFTKTRIVFHPLLLQKQQQPQLHTGLKLGWKCMKILSAWLL
mgnify:CR=1 FL=1